MLQRQMTGKCQNNVAVPALRGEACRVDTVEGNYFSRGIGAFLAYPDEIKARPGGQDGDSRLMRKPVNERR